MKINRKIIEINKDLCDGCGLCTKACVESAIQIVNGKATLVSDKFCDGLGVCIGECPKGALKIFERLAEEFDPNAVEMHLETKKQEELSSNNDTAKNNSTVEIQQLRLKESYKRTNNDSASYLTHWPIKIRLIQTNAPFLKNASLLIASDCTTVVLPNFQKDFLKGRIVMIGCPKYDEREAYVEKFAEIFELNDIREIVVLVMEVPCCHSLPIIVKRGLAIAEKDIPLVRIVVNPKGDIVDKSLI